MRASWRRRSYRDAANLLEDTLAKVHKSAAWRDYMAKNMYKTST